MEGRDRRNAAAGQIIFQAGVQTPGIFGLQIRVAAADRAGLHRVVDRAADPDFAEGRPRDAALPGDAEDEVVGEVEARVDAGEEVRVALRRGQRHIARFGDGGADIVEHEAFDAHARDHLAAVKFQLALDIARQRPFIELVAVLIRHGVGIVAAVRFQLRQRMRKLRNEDKASVTTCRA